MERLPSGFRTLSGSLGMQFNSDEGCIIVWKAIRLGNMNPIWNIDKKINNFQELKKDSQLILLIQSNKKIDEELR